MAGEEFGKKDHSRHFMLVSISLLAAAVISLYVLNSFGYFGITGQKDSLTEQTCAELFGTDLEFNEVYNDGNLTIKELNFVENSSITKFTIESSDNALKCARKKRANQSMFKAKGLGAGSYKCGNIEIAYSAGVENNYYSIAKEIALPDSIELNTTFGSEKTDNEQINSMISKSSGSSAEAEFSDKFIQQIIYLNSNVLYESELKALRSSVCPEFMELVSL